ncbi:MAG TPA: hypothetical protein VKS21_07770, partial [Spirochaetota bacterium]|nr:hypothetical protein [Spirochaetota bacterium]
TGEILKSQQQSVSLAGYSYRMAQTQYEQGVTDLQSLNQSMNDYNEARLKQLRTLYENFTAKINLAETCKINLENFSQ